MAGQQNAATQILSDLTTQDTNPFLATQLQNAIGGAVDKVSSQYALGGRLGSDSFAGALGAGITGAAAPILSQNLQQDRANQLAAAQALGQVSGQDIGRALQSTTAAQIGQQDLGQQANIAQSLLGAQQADLGRDATLANQLTAASEADARARLAAIGAAPGLLVQIKRLSVKLHSLAVLSVVWIRLRWMQRRHKRHSKTYSIKTRSMLYSVLLAWVAACLDQQRRNLVVRQVP